MDKQGAAGARLNHLIDLNHYSVSQWNEILRLAADIQANPRIYEGSCTGRIMGTLFYEPSTRTQMSFQSAMLRLGGGIIGFVNPEATTSVSKGESLKDTIKIVSGYADVIVMRHNLEGAAKAAAISSDCPVINAGDGGHLHPTQTLTDLMTLHCEKGQLENLTIAICGDLKHGRTVHSLVKALTCYAGNRFVLISTKELRIPAYIREIIERSNCIFHEVNSIEEALTQYKPDMLYMTRIQRERFDSQWEYKEQASRFILDTEKMALAPKEMIVLHPLPRLNEIAIAVDDDPRALYFKQANYGMYVRMALILKILNYDLCPQPQFAGKALPDLECRNMKCITRFEPYLPHQFRQEHGTAVCEFCEEMLLC